MGQSKFPYENKTQKNNWSISQYIGLLTSSRKIHSQCQIIFLASSLDSPEIYKTGKMVTGWFYKINSCFEHKHENNVVLANNNFISYKKVSCFDKSLWYPTRSLQVLKFTRHFVKKKAFSVKGVPLTLKISHFHIIHVCEYVISVVLSNNISITVTLIEVSKTMNRK